MMIILDTNVVSELLRPAPSIAVVSALRGFATDRLHLTSITAAELRLGYSLLPPGRRREEFRAKVEEYLGDRPVLPFDDASSHRYAALMAHRRSLGRPIAIMDAQIAAIVLTRGAILATRNIKDFEHCAVPLVNPWDQALPA